MENMTKTAVTASAYGKKIDPPITFSFAWTNYTDTPEQRAANDMLTDEEQLKVRNDQRENKARQAAQKAAWDAAGYTKPTEENDDQLRLKNMFKTLMSSKLYTEEAARTLAATTLNLKWEVGE